MYKYYCQATVIEKLQLQQFNTICDYELKYDIIMPSTIGFLLPISMMASILIRGTFV